MTRLMAYIDESGQRGRNGSRHFVMSALIVRDDRVDEAIEAMHSLKVKLNRKPDHVLHWKNYKNHTYRLVASTWLADRTDLFRTISVVVCKDHLAAGSHMNDDMAYMYTFRFLLERLSWFARSCDAELSYTLGHVVRFPMEKLREYERLLRAKDTQIKWHHLNNAGGAIDQPSRVPLLQVADIVASATGAAFNEDEHGFTESRYLTTMRPVMYTPPNGLLTTYGLKMHPWNDSTKAAYPWVATL